MNTLNVIQIIDSLEAGGAEMLAVNIANGFAKQNINSYLCATRKEGPLKENLKNEVRYLFLERKHTFDINAIINLNNYIKKENIGLIHAHSTSAFIAVCMKFLNPRIKIIWHDHFGDRPFVTQRKIISLKAFSFFFSAIIVVNDKLKNWALNNLYCKSIFYLKNFAVFIHSNKQIELKGKEGKRIVIVAGYRIQKDHLTLLKAFLLVSKEHPNWTLHLIGKSYQDNYSDSIHNFIKEVNLTEEVFEYGVCSDIENILSQADIGVLSSKSEGLPVALLEYGLAKLPVVVTDVGDCRKVVKNNGGILVEKENATDLAKAISELINSKEKRIKFGKKLFDTVNQKYSETEFIKKVTSIYKELI